RTIMAPPTPDTGLLEARDEIDAVGMTDESEVTPESAAEPDARKAAPSDEPAAPPPVDVSAESDVITELKDAEAAGRGVDKKQKAPSKSEDVTSALEADEQPAESVDELLESGAGVVTDADGDVFIRGGRAGEVVYIVDSAPPDSARKEVADTYLTTSATDSLRYTLDLGLSRDVDGPLDFPGSKEAYQNYPTGSIDLSDIAVIPPEAEAKPDTTKSLDDWRAVRDSLQPYFADKQLVYGLRAQKSIEATDGSASPPASPAPVVDTVVSPRQLERYLEACYKIAELTDRESEYDSALVVIEKHARDRYSPARHRARHYLDLIDELQE
ncbi:MAG: hypothetical protein OEV68_10260, partial [candidate division Zixibacteria bacterium]|nr:hypothetical protein [candidate division Zixibacteria bacterium]